MQSQGMISLVYLACHQCRWHFAAGERAGPSLKGQGQQQQTTDQQGNDDMVNRRRICYSFICTLHIHAVGLLLHQKSQEVVCSSFFGECPYIWGGAPAWHTEDPKFNPWHWRVAAQSVYI